MARKAPSNPQARPLLDLDCLSDEDVLAVLIQSVSPTTAALPWARTLLDRAEDLAGLARASFHDLGGSTPRERRVALGVAAGIELGLRCAERPARKRSPIRCSADVVRVVGPRLRLIDHEQLWILGLDGSSRATGLRRLAEGGRHGCAVLARDVLRSALAIGACSFVLVHNHPAGDPSPSRHDIDLTTRLAAASECIGIPLVDHIIVASDAHVSLLDIGLLGAPGAIGATRQSPSVDAADSSRSVG